MRGKYRIRFYPDEIGEWRWRCTASNGRIVADSGEGYKRRADARKMAMKLFRWDRWGDFLFDDEVVEDLDPLLR